LPRPAACHDASVGGGSLDALYDTFAAKGGLQSFLVLLVHLLHQFFGLLLIHVGASNGFRPTRYVGGSSWGYCALDHLPKRLY